MVEYFSVEEINCKKSSGNGKWQCDLTRRFTEKPYKTDGKICYDLKTETLENLEDIHLSQGKLTKCFYRKNVNSLRYTEE